MIRLPRPLLAVSLLLASAAPLWAQSTPASQPAASRPAATSPGALPATFPAGPTDEQCLELGGKIEKAMIAGDMIGINLIVNRIQLLDKAARGLNIPEDSKWDLLPLLRSSESIGRGMTSLAKGPGSCKLLRVHRVDGQPCVLLRVVAGASGITYLDVEAGYNSEGQVGITDVHMYMQGQAYSDGVRQAILTSGASRGRGEGLTGADKQFVAYLPQIQKMQLLIGAGKHEQALQMSAGLPPELRNRKPVIFARLVCAARIRSPEYVPIATEFAKVYPADPALGLLSLDNHLASGQLNEALADLDSIDQAIGGDPYLDSVRASVCLTTGDLPKAKEFATQAIAREPELERAYVVLLGLSLREKNFAETARLLTTLETKLHVKLPVLTMNPEYAGFVASDAYTAWMKSRPRP